MDTNRRSRRSRSHGKHIAAALAVILVISLLFWWTSAQQMPAITIPKPVMPNPNAFDTFNDAAALQLDAGKVGYAISTKHSGQVKDDRDYTWEEKQKLLAENAPVLALLREGLLQEYRNPPLRSMNTLFPYYAKDRSMARLLALDSSVKAHRGDYSGAVRSSMDAMDLGAQVPHGSTLIGGLVGVACSAIGRRPLWQFADKLSAEEARAAAQRIERIRTKWVPFSETMLEEKWATQASMLEMMRSPNAIGAAAQSMGGPAPAIVNSPLASNLLFLVYSKRRIMNDYTTYVDGEIARAKQPYGSTKPTPVPNNPIVQIFVPVYDQASLKSAANEAQNALVEVVYALRAYRVQHGKYPDKLDELTPSILPRIPTDPFTAGAALKYRRAGGSYALYSIGPDGKDDGGTAIDSGASQSSNPNERYFTKADSKGDIVAGKNMW